VNLVHKSAARQKPQHLGPNHTTSRDVARQHEIVGWHARCEGCDLEACMQERWPPVDKDLEALARRPVLTDYEAERATFTWEAARARLDGLPGDGLNIAHEAVTRHVRGGRGDRVAIRAIDKAGAVEDITYADLERRSNRVANALASLGLQPGERVFLLLGRVPALVETVLGALKGRHVICPLFSAFGPEPIKQRLEIGDGRVLVTTPQLYRRKVAPNHDQLPGLKHVLLVGESWDALVAEASEDFPIPPTDPEDMALLHFTSGTTGKPKGAVHVHGAVVHHHNSGRYALDLQEGDVYWCTADPGWVTGMSYGIISPLCNGVTMLFYEAEFEAEAWYRTLAEHEVAIWYTAPTAVRMMMKVGTELARRYQLPKLRFVASVGEPLNPEGVTWGIEAFGLPIHDNWWQTETGGIMIANFAAMPIKPGSMGRPLPGIEATVVRRNDDGTVTPVAGAEGELALIAGWPSMMRAYLNEPSRYDKCFADGTDGRRYYLSGDLAEIDDDGYFWFVGRADDVINTSGHLIGPFEVESVLMEHPAVAEVGVIGKPDPMAMEIVKAFVALKPGHTESDELRRELLGLARKHLGAVVAPKEIAFLPSLPKTRSGKIMRRLLKARELGLPEGDLSTLETDSR
jgi:acetyl-CoA synthetase